MTVSDVLMSIYPKRGSQGIVDLVDTEYGRLVEEMTIDKK
jgi:hypothetical protein